MERLSENGDDKTLLLKLQNEVNFLRKKQEEAFETLILKEKELEEAKLAAKEALRKEHLRDENSQKFLQRKVKEISEKDKFIQNFLLSRAKQLERASVDASSVR
jgi:hypothetical protein